MSHYTVSFAGKNDPDRAALIETVRYLGQTRFKLLVRLAKTAKAFRAVDFHLCFTGVQGYPNHAFGRRYCLDLYRAWMHEEPNPVLTNEKGFPL